MDKTGSQYGAYLAEESKQTAAKTLATVLASMGAAGVVSRGTLGVMNLLRGPRELKVPEAPLAVQIPVPAKARRRRRPAIQKAAALPPPTTPTMPQLPIGAQQIYNAVATPLDAARTGALEVLKGSQAENASGVPWLLPALALGGPLAGYGAWKATDWAMDRQRKQLLDRDIEDAAQEYHDLMTSKSAAAQELDELAGLFEKRASGLGQVGGAALAVPLTAFAAAALPSAYLGYRFAKKRSPKIILEEALQRRLKSRFGGQVPPALLAISDAEAA